MILKTVLVESDDRESIKKALCEITPIINADFSGDNGEEHTSEEALKKGFASDLEMCFDKYSKYSNRTFTEAIIREMCYGSKYDYEIVVQNKHIKAISITVDWDF